MKATISSTNLADRMAFLKRAVAKRSTLPILSHVLLQAQAGGTLRLAATDLSVYFQTTISSQVEETGAITAPSDTLAHIAAHAGEGPILFKETPTGKLSIRYGKAKTSGGDEKDEDQRGKEKPSRALLNPESPEEFPSLPESERTDILSLPAEELERAARHAAPAANPEAERTFCQGIWICTQQDGTDATVLAVDGFRLARRRVRLEKPAAQAVQLLLPLPAVSFLKAFETIQLQQTENHSIISDGNGTSLHTTRIEATLPDIDAIIPKEDPLLQVKVTNQALQQALRVVQGFSPYKVSLHVTEKEVFLEADDSDNRAAAGVDQAIPLWSDVAKEKDMVVLLSKRFLHDALRSATKENLLIKIWHPLKPVHIITSSGDDVILPMEE